MKHEIMRQFCVAPLYSNAKLFCHSLFILLQLECQASIETRIEFSPTENCP